MVDTFTWPTQVGDTGTESASVRKAQFGDGYRQRAANGINNVAQSWPLTISGPAEMIFAIRNFLRAHKGSAAFYWTPPGDAQGLYSCDTWTIKPVGGIAYTLTATFNQEFSS